MNIGHLSLGPFQGLASFEESSAEFFFGRESETRLIVANLYASPLTILYGASGVGKSSVLRAGVLHELRSRSDILPVLIQNWQGDPLSGLLHSLARAANLPPEEVRLPGSAAASKQWIEGIAQRTCKRLVIMLDQFEDYFLYHSEDRDFFHVFSLLLMQTREPISFLVSIREDLYAKLDRFEGHIPFLFDNYLRIEHLTPEAARVAIEGPIQQYNAVYAAGSNSIGIEPALVEEVLRHVQAGKVSLEGGAGRAVPATHPSWIETPYLQLVMVRLWNYEMEAGSSLLRLRTLRALGGAQKIVRTHLDEVMKNLEPDDQNIAAKIFHHLVTPSGTRIAHTPRDLSGYVEEPPNRVAAILEDLSRGSLRILRPLDAVTYLSEGVRYEIFHDVLTAAVLDWRERYLRDLERADAAKRLTEEVQERAKAEKQLARERRLATVLAALMLAMTALAALSFFQWKAVTKAESALHESIKEISSQRDSLARAKAAAVEGTKRAERERQNAVQAKIYLEAANAEILAQRDEALQARAEAVLQRSAAGQARNESEKAKASAEQAALAAEIATRENAEQKVRAELATRVAKSHELASRAAEVFARDPVLSAMIAVEAERIIHTEQAEEALRRALTEVRSRRLLRGHRGPVRISKFSGDSQWIVTAGEDGIARMWSAMDPRVHREILAHGAPIAALATSRDGRLMATASFDHTARIWSLPDGKMKQELTGQLGPITHVLFSPDGNRVFTAGWDGRLICWEISSGKEVSILWDQAVPITAVKLSPEGDFIAAANLKGEVLLRRISGRHRVAVLRGHAGAVKDLEFSPDGKMLASGDTNGIVLLRNVENKRQMSLWGHTGAIQSVRFSPDGGLLVSASADRTAIVWDTHLWLKRWRLVRHSAEVTSATFSADSRQVFTTSSDLTVIAWDMDTGRPISELREHTGAVRGFELSPDGRVAATPSDDETVVIWSIADSTPELNIGSSSLPMSRAVKNLNESLLLTVNSDAVAHVWDSLLGTLVGRLEGHSGEILDIAFNQHGNSIVTASADRSARIWDQEALKCALVLRGHADQVRSASFSYSGHLVVTASVDRTARVWNATTGQILAQLKGHAAALRRAEFSPDDRMILTSSDDGTARLWNVESGTQINVLKAHGKALNDAVFSPGGDFIATASDDHTAIIWGKDARPLHALRGHSDRVVQVAFSPDSRLLATASIDRSARVWNTATGRLQFELRGHSASVLSIEFSSNGRWLLTTGADGSTRVWDLRNGRQMKEVRATFHPVKEGMFSQDSGRIFAASHDGKMRIYRCEECGDSASLLRLAGERIFREWSPEDRTEYLGEQPFPDLYPPGLKAPPLTSIKLDEFARRFSGLLEKGTASWYGPKFHGRRTASGERFDMNEMTAAHPSLPFGTLVEVVNARNGRSVAVRINDRGPFSRSRIIELSFAAAKEIGLVVTGTTPVQIYRLDPLKGQDSSSYFTVQAGVFDDYSQAHKLHRDLKTLFADVYIYSQSGVHKVRVGKFDDEEGAKVVGQSLSALGLSSSISQY